MAAGEGEHKRLLKGRYAVNFDLELPSMETDGGAAYACRDVNSPADPYYALVPKDGAAWRHRALELTLGRGTAHLLCPLEAGPVEIDGGWIETVILPLPTGGCIGEKILLQPMSERNLRHHLLPDIAAGLQALAAVNLAHRNVRPARIYCLDQSGTSFALSECFSDLPGASQPLIFEPIERAMAYPSGRGEGETADDMFALGVTVLTLLTGQLPCADMSADEVMTARIGKGSYLAYLQGITPRGAFGALLRGLLCDDPKQRWTLEKLRRWLDGMLPAEPISVQAHSVATGYKFQGETYGNRRLLAHALHSNFESAIAELYVPGFQNWLKTAVKDEMGAAVVERLFSSALTKTGKSTERATQRLHAGSLSKVIQTLDPQGPIRFHSLCLMADGLAGFVAHAMKMDETSHLKDLEELCGRGSLREVATIAAGESSHMRRLLTDFSDIERHIGLHAPGSGAERALYQLNPGLLCQSPLLAHFHVATVAQLLTALDGLAQEKPERDLLMDRHIAAFLACRWTDAGGLIAGLAHHERLYPERIVHTLRLYAFAQQAYAMPPLPALARHFAAKLAPAVKALHHGRTRDLMLKKIERLAQEGTLIRFHDELNLLAIRERDRDRFAAAGRMLAYVESELAAINRGFKPADPAAVALGRRIAMGAAWFAIFASAYFTFMVRL